MCIVVWCGVLWQWLVWYGEVCRGVVWCGMVCRCGTKIWKGKRTLTVWTKEKIQLHLKMPMGTAFLCPYFVSTGRS